jgi:hypothetical protein
MSRIIWGCNEEVTENSLSRGEFAEEKGGLSLDIWLLTSDTLGFEFRQNKKIQTDGNKII